MKLRHAIIWKPGQKVIAHYPTKSQAKKALQSYLTFHHAKDQKDEYAICLFVSREGIK